MNTLLHRVIRTLCGPVFLFRFALPCAAAEDPSRFQFVAAWEAQVTINLNSSGNYPAADWSVSRSASFSIGLPAQLGGLQPPLLTWNGEQTLRLDQVSVQDRVTVRPDPDDEPTTLTVAGVLNSPFPPTAQGYVLIDLAASNYIADFAVAYFGNATIDGTTVPGLCPIPGIIPSETRFPLPETGTTLTGTYTYPVDLFCNLTTVSCNDCVLSWPASMQVPAIPGTVQFTWTLTPKEIELVVEPQDYEYWLPEGSLKTPDKRGNTIKVSAKLQAKGGGPAPAKATSMYFELINVSANPGVCMNFPLNSQLPPFDLRFEPDLNPSPSGAVAVSTDTMLGYISTDPQAGMTHADAIVSSFDFGGYAEIRVTAEVNGTELVGYLKGVSPKIEEIPIPKCESGSQIADFWKEQHGLGSQPDEHDNDDLPEGDGHHGDGFSLFEEYRGFSQDRVHLRTNPSEKDLFVRDTIGSAQIKSAIKQAETVSGLKIHHKLRKDEIRPDRVVNFNAGHGHQNFSQHGLILMGRQKQTGQSEAISIAQYDEIYSTPGSIQRLEIDPLGSRTRSRDGSVGYRSFNPESVAHEIMHGCGVSHHGECDPSRNRNLKILWAEAGDGTQAEVRRVGGVTLSITPITIHSPEGGDPFLLWTLVQGTQVKQMPKIWLAAPHGQHSGDPACIMAYNGADGFRRDHGPRRFQLIRWPKVHQNHLCASPAGKGINASGAAGGSWLGDAYQGGSANQNRGNCAGQVCVNDRYVDDTSKHKQFYPCEAW